MAIAAGGAACKPEAGCHGGPARGRDCKKNAAAELVLVGAQHQIRPTPLKPKPHPIWSTKPPVSVPPTLPLPTE